jgi:hypothetical protein
MKLGAMKRHLSLWLGLKSVLTFPSLFSALYEILRKRNVVTGNLRGTWRGEGIALFYGRKSSDIDECAVKLYGRLRATP